MSLENSPKLGECPSFSFNLRAWIRRNQVTLFVVCGTILALNLGLLVFQVALMVTAPPPGGLDGCVVAVDDQPANAMVWVDDRSRHTFTDGCFFFATLSPGTHALRIILENGYEWTQPVSIKSGQAVGLNTLRSRGR
jgi:hypothetical protein